MLTGASTTLGEDFRGFLQPLQAIAGIAPENSHDRFLTRILQLIIITIIIIGKQPLLSHGLP
jgi:hypothetical protein